MMMQDRLHATNTIIDIDQHLVTQNMTMQWWCSVNYCYSSDSRYSFATSIEKYLYMKLPSIIMDQNYCSNFNMMIKTTEYHEYINQWNVVLTTKFTKYSLHVYLLNPATAFPVIAPINELPYLLKNVIAFSSAITRSISAFVVSCPTLKRIVFLAVSLSIPHDRSTCDALKMITVKQWFKMNSTICCRNDMQHRHLRWMFCILRSASTHRLRIVKMQHSTCLVIVETFQNWYTHNFHRVYSKNIINNRNMLNFMHL